MYYLLFFNILAFEIKFEVDYAQEHPPRVKFRTCQYVEVDDITFLTIVIGS